MLAVTAVYTAAAGEIQGVVVVKRKLTRRVAVPEFNAYERGAAAPRRPPVAEITDPLEYERTHTVVFLEGRSLPTIPVIRTIEQEGRAFFPDFVALPAGSAVSFPNLDPIFHNVFSLSKAKSFDLGNYSKGQSRSVTFAEPGIVLVNCRIHTNMSAVVVVTPNKFYAPPDAKGAFTLSGVPPGKCTITAWHKAAGFLHKEITVSGETPVAVDFLLPLDAPPVPALTSARP